MQDTTTTPASAPAPAHTYAFDYASNGYFEGRDGWVTRDDGRTIRIQSYDGEMAVNVKNHDWTPDDPDLARMADDLNAAHPEDHYGMPWTMSLYDNARDQFWQDADLLAQDHGFDGVHAAGRSDGWMVVEGTRWLAGNFLSDPPRPLTEEDAEAMEMRDRFLACAFEALDYIKGARDNFHDMIRDAHHDLEMSREACLVKGEN